MSYPANQAADGLRAELDDRRHTTMSATRRAIIQCGLFRASLSGYSGSVSPDPPISAGKSFIFGSPSFIGCTVDS